MDLDFFFGAAPAPTSNAANSNPIATAPPGGPIAEDPFGMFGGTAAPKPNSPQTQAPATVAGGGDFFDMFGGQQPANQPASQPFQRGASKGQETKKDLNFDAFNQLAVSRTQPQQKSKGEATKKEGSSSESDSSSDSSSSSGSDSGDSKVKAPVKKDGGSKPKNGGAKGPKEVDSKGQTDASAPRKTRGDWSIEKKKVPTNLGFVKNITIWKFFFKGEQHVVELRHSTFSGKRVILVDGRQLVSEKKLVSSDSAHRLFAGSDFETRCDITVVIKSVNDHFQYGIFIEGEPIREAKKKFAEYI